jgi:cell division protein FtsL
MSIDLEYAIKKDIRNNPVIREIDLRERREFRRIFLLAALSVGLLLFAAWQHFETLRQEMAIEQLRKNQQDEERMNRQLRLNVETLRAPQKLEERARRELGLTAPTVDNTIVIERAVTSAPSPNVLAQVR